MGTDASRLEQLSIDTIRTLAMDAVQKANAGHPGTAMSLAPVAYLLYRERLAVNPSNPAWQDRDRFVLSAGHACILQYATLHLTGFALAMGDLEQFRQWGSITPGHPELDSEVQIPGVEVTTGPLGQGVGNAVGMALAERMLAARYNRPGFDVIDHRTWAIASDGDMMEGVSGEASSIAGHLGLARLTVIYDDNHITIEGDTALAFDEDVCGRYAAYGWHTQKLEDGWTNDDLRAAFDAAEAEDARPSFIQVRTHIAWGAPNAQDTAEAHGAPLGEDEVRATKQVYGWDPDKHFFVPDGVYEHMDRRAAGAEAERAWDELFARYREAHPQEAAELERVWRHELPDGWEDALPDFAGAKPQATRVSSGATINALAAAVPELVGGSADLAPSTNTLIKDAESVSAGSYGGRNLHFGIREHGMGSILNGMLAHGGLRPFGATFLIFSDYMRPSVRLACLMELPAIYVWTHDSVGLGEDGPTHQPVEALASLRAMPRMRILRPCDAAETAEAWRLALSHTHGPTGMALSRQALPVLDRSVYAPVAGARRGAYVLADADGAPEVVLMGSGSEVHQLLEARETLAGEGRRVRVVSFLSTEIFAEQDAAYRDEVLPPGVWRRISLEAAATFGWQRWVGERGIALGIDRFGASAPGARVLAELGITSERVVEAARRLFEED